MQTRRHGEYAMDEFPQGTNAVVAVISYTGYDMEDAMILNKVGTEKREERCVFIYLFVFVGR